ncbi:MAG TPA: AgmX/PglI C-terminal domain-containing protein [Anaeromyxobacter sp.]|nr:AgmX/PglI C-terminal domain-containing protein [Anaeromyxobacter sp.]
MAPGTDEIPLDQDPRLDGGEWLFRRGGQVFGPVDSRGVAAMLYRGEIDGQTPLSTGDGSWRPVSAVPIFLVHAKKAEAAARVEREVTGARLLRERRNRRRAVAAVVGVVLLVAGAVGTAVFLTRGTAGTSPLLEDFGAGIRIASAAKVGVSGRAVEEDLVDVPLDAPERAAAPRRRAARPASSPAPAQGTVAGGELVAEHFDAKKIQAVVGREQRTLAPCFREEASRSPDFRGDVPIEFAIGNDGRVVQLWIDEPRFRKGPLEQCLSTALATWRFDPFPGQRPTVSLAFRIGR